MRPYEPLPVDVASQRPLRRLAWLFGPVGLLLLLPGIYYAGEGQLWHAFSGAGSERVEVSGAVRFRGVPVDTGTIQFIPQILPLRAGEFHGGAAAIWAGEYHFAEDQGLVPGLYQVQIEPKGEEITVTGRSGPKTLALPSSGRQPVFLSVRKNGPNRFDFEIK